MYIDNFEECLKLANDFLVTKKRKNYYGFTCYDEECHEDVIFYNELSEEEVDSLRILREKYADLYTDHLDELWNDPDVIHDLAFGNQILDIDLDHIIHMYTFKIHELKPDSTVYDHNCYVILRDNQYAKLLAWHLYDEHFTINTLRRLDTRLYDTIMREIDNHFLEQDGHCYFVSNPYVATLDEAKADADFIVKQNNIILTGYYRCH